jgi:hypothetical protein
MAQATLEPNIFPYKYPNSLIPVIQPVTDPSVPSAIEMFDVELRYYFLTPPNVPKLTTLDDVQEASGVSRTARLRSQTVFRTGP